MVSGEWYNTARHLQRRRQLRFRLIVIALIILIGLSVGLTISRLGNYYHEHQYSGTVTDKVVKTSGSGSSTSSTYLVFVKLDDGTTRVFEDTDSLRYMKFNSSDIYGELQTGHHYTFTVYGWRDQLFSMYENIVKVSPQ